MMKLKIGNYLVKLEAKCVYGSQTDRTKMFLCLLSNVFFEAYDFNDHEGYHDIARERLGMATDIHAYLDSLEYFADVKEKVNSILKEEMK